MADELPKILDGNNTRQMNDAEYAQWQADKAEVEAQAAALEAKVEAQAAALEAKAAARQAVIDKLGLTADEAAALFG